MTPDQIKFCDQNCALLDHHPDCPLIFDEDSWVPLMIGDNEMTSEGSMNTRLMNDDGDNLAVWAFLNEYRSAYQHTLGTMMRQMSLAGFRSHPEWLADYDMTSCLTESEAQRWLRFLFELEEA